MSEENRIGPTGFVYPSRIYGQARLQDYSAVEKPTLINELKAFSSIY